MDYDNNSLNRGVFEAIKRIQSLAEIGLEYNKISFDRERYNEIQEICFRLISEITDIETDKIKLQIVENNGYKTPKVDVRAVVFNEKNEILLVKEKVDGLWSLPGGWADIGYPPSAVAVKECFEEAGLVVTPQKLIAVLDKTKQKMPPELEYVYKIFIGCEPIGSNISPGEETSDAQWFSEDNLPDFSLPRINKNQISKLFEFHKNENIKPFFD